MRATETPEAPQQNTTNQKQDRKASQIFVRFRIFLKIRQKVTPFATLRGLKLSIIFGPYFFLGRCMKDNVLLFFWQHFDHDFVTLFLTLWGAAVARHKRLR